MNLLLTIAAVANPVLTALLTILVFLESKKSKKQIEDIKNSTNRKLKSKLRRAKSRIEVDMWSIMILQEQLNEDENKDS